MKRVRLIAALTLILSACGYSIGRLGPVPVRDLAVAPVVEDGVDVDAAALVDGWVRRMVARGPRTRLVPNARQTLEVELVQVRTKLAAFAEPGLRAAPYVVRVGLVARLLDERGRVLWKSRLIRGEGSFLSPPGRIEALDGARRRGLAQAAEEAASRVVVSLIAAPPMVGTSSVTAS